MYILYFIIGIVYLVIGMIIAHKKWEWDGYDLYGAGVDEVIVTLFWPVWLSWFTLKTLIEEFF